MSRNNFIGLGHNPNPNVPDIPEGFGAALSNEPKALKGFENLSDAQKTAMIEYIQSNNATGNDARIKINDAVNKLKKQTFEFD